MRCWRGPVDVGVSGWVLQNNKAQLVNDMLNDPRGALVPGTEWEPQASIIAPLTLGDTAIGVLALDRLGDRTFDECELDPVSLFANLAAIAIHNARQYEEAGKASRQLEEQLALSHELLSASGAVLSSLEQTEVLARIADPLKQIVDYDTMDVRLVDAERRQLVRHLRPRRGRGAGGLRGRHPDGRRGQRLGRAPQRGAARQRHGPTRAPSTCPAPRSSSRRPASSCRSPWAARSSACSPSTGWRTHLRTARAGAGASVRQPRRDRHPERRQLRRAGDDVGPARGPARSAARALRPQRGAAQLARPARRVRAHHHDAQGHRRLRRHGHPPRRRGDARAGVHLLARPQCARCSAFRISIDRGPAGWVVRHDEAQLVNDMIADPRVVQVPGTGGGRAAGAHRRPARTCAARSPAS